MTLAPTQPCPCGAGSSYAACCGRYLAGARVPTAEALMRSRFTAFATGDVTHLSRTWHPRTRPPEVTTDRTIRWTRLEILATSAGGVDDQTGEVRFAAHHDGPDGPGVLTEHSRFERRGGRWTYVEGDQLL